MAEETKLTEEDSQPSENEPWFEVFSIQESFHIDLECIGEMISLVLPVLKRKDEDRNKHMNKLIAKIEAEKELSLRFNTAHDINEFIEHVKKLRLGDIMFRQGIITIIVSKFDKFLIKVLNICYKMNPGWLNIPDKKMSYKEILEIESLDSLKNEIIQKEIDLLMRDSHQSQICFLDSKLKLGIESNFPKWNEFLEITERRNLFVHTGGIVSPQYLNNCERLRIKIDDETNEGKYLSADDSYIQNAIDCFYEISVRITQALTRRLFPKCFEDADKEINNQTVDLLIEERWELAERIFEFAIGIPEDLTSKGETKYYFLINLCIARKFSGKPFKEYLHSVDWTPFHPKYKFAVAILEDRFDDAETLMRSQAVQTEIPEQFFREWPLLREFRKTNLFLTAFKDIYKKDFNEELIEEVEKEIKAHKKDAATTALLGG